MGVAAAEEPVEEVWQLIRWDSGSGVGDGERSLRAVPSEGHGYPAARWGELGGVGEQVRHDLGEAQLLTAHAHRCESCRDGDVGFGEAAGQPVEGVGGDSGQVDRLPADGERRRVGGGEGLQVGDQPAEADRFVV